MAKEAGDKSAEKKQVERAQAPKDAEKKKAEKKADKKGEKTPKAAQALTTGNARNSFRPAGPPRLLKRYREQIVPALMKEFGYRNVNQVPKLDKIVLNMGLGKEAVNNPNVVSTAVEELTVIAGQRAVATKSKKAISNFKLRAGLPIGCMVTLRRERMWEFLDRLLSVAMPRVRDFKGISPKAFDQRGNYSLGIREHIIFPEINYDKVDKIKGMNVTIATTARNDNEGRALLKELGVPFRT